jgi:hypothetical protein
LREVLGGEVRGALGMKLSHWLKGLEPSIHRYAEHFRELEA